MEFDFFTRLENLIDEAVQNGVDMDEIVSVLGLKVDALEEVID